MVGLLSPIQIFSRLGSVAFGPPPPPPTKHGGPSTLKKKRGGGNISPPPPPPHPKKNWPENPLPFSGGGTLPQTRGRGKKFFGGGWGGGGGGGDRLAPGE